MKQSALVTVQEGQQRQKHCPDPTTEQNRINLLQRAAIHAQQLNAVLVVGDVEALLASMRNKLLGGTTVCADAVLQQQRHLALRIISPDQPLCS